MLMVMQRVSWKQRKEKVDPAAQPQAALSESYSQCQLSANEQFETDRLAAPPPLPPHA